MTEQLRLHLPAPRSFVWCVHCLGFHERAYHDRAWRAQNAGDRDAVAIYTRPPRPLVAANPPHQTILLRVGLRDVRVTLPASPVLRPPRVLRLN